MANILLMPAATQFRLQTFRRLIRLQQTKDHRQRACTDYRYQCGNATRFGQDDPGSGPQLPGR